MIKYELVYTFGHQQNNEEINAETDECAIEEAHKYMEKLAKDIGFDGTIEFKVNKIVIENIFEGC